MKCININKNIEGRFLNVLFFLFTIFTYSQKYPIKYGIKAGWNYSNVNAVDENSEPSGYLSNGGELYGGIALEKQITKKSYIQSGFVISYTDAITFLEIPIYYKAYIYNNLSIIIGPKFNYIPDSEESQPYYFRKRFGMSGDIGMNYKISKYFIIEGIFSKGFTKQYDDLLLSYYHARRDVYRIGLIYLIN